MTTATPNIYQKIAQISGLIVTKNARNAFKKYLYADIGAIIEAITPLLQQVGLVIVTELTVVEGCQFVTTKVVSTDNPTEFVQCVVSCGEVPKTPAQIQDLGCMITYARRYSLLSLFNIATDEDSDAIDTPHETSKTKQRTKTNSAGFNQPSSPTQQPQQPKPPSPRQDHQTQAPPPQDAYMAESNQLITQLGWSNEDGKRYLQKHFNKKGRGQLTIPEWERFIADLRSACQVPG